MTAYWARSATGRRYPYYNCQTRDCSHYRKAIRAEKIDAGFEDILRSMKPSKNMLDIAMSMLKDAWDQRGDQAKQAKAEIRRQHNALDKQQDALVERMIETSNPKVMAALESKIAKLEEDKLLLTDKLSQNTKPKRTLGEIIELFKDFLSNPWNIYDNGSLEVRKAILKTAFKAPLAYDRQNGYRTPQVSVIFEFFADFTSKCEMVRSAGLEPARVLPHSDLNAARLPIPPRPQILTGSAVLIRGSGTCEVENDAPGGQTARPFPTPPVHGFHPNDPGGRRRAGRARCPARPAPLPPCPTG